MSEELNEETGGLSRRSMIKRGAIVGGTLVWAQPVVQGFGTAAGASSHMEGPLEGFSYIAVVFTCSGTTYKAKLELDDNTGTVSFVDPGNTPGDEADCTPAGYTGATPVSGQAADDLLDISQTGDIVTVTAVCQGGEVLSGTIKQGATESSSNVCAPGTPSGNHITFDTRDVGPN